MQPNHGVFVENRLRHLVGHGGIRAGVLAPVPWFPFTSERFGRYGELAKVPLRENRFGIAIDHPRYPMLPKIGMALQPWLLYRAMVPHLRRMIALDRRPDLIDAHYVYPDGVAAALLARRFGLPLAITARGTDLNLIPQHPLARRWIRFAIREASGLVGVCEALARRFVELGADPAKVRALRNGVDLDLFRPTDRDAARRELGVSGPVLLLVGQLIERKGAHLAIDALSDLPEHTLLLAGDGPERHALGERARKGGVAPRVRFLGAVPHAELPGLYTAADALLLPSSREGWANVLLESMACGTPVIATDIWGTPEVVTCPEAGVLMRERAAGAIVEAWHRLETVRRPRAATRAHAEGFGWEPTSRGQIELFNEIVRGNGRGVHVERAGEGRR
ncbi:MAG: glycosyltransferase [Geminicoccaceae bacterium]|nr:glycosyltransferase [Geminicoccaceae bacterium]